MIFERYPSARIAVFLFSLLALLRPALAACPSDTRFYVGYRDRVPTSPNPYFVHSYGTGDFNGDGLADVILGHVFTGQDVKLPLEILVNDGNGKFVEATSQVIKGSIPALWHPRRMAVADFNNDGRDDVFVAGHGIERAPSTGEPNKLLLSTSDGKLVDASNNIPQLIDYSHGLAAGDIDGDGDVDIVVGNFRCGEFGPYLLLNNGSGVFTLDRSRLPANEFCNGKGNMGSLLLIDINHDGVLDLVIGDHYQDVSRVYLNDRHGYFRDSARIDLPASYIGGRLVHTVDIQAADIDADGNVDLIMSNVDPDYQGRNIQILVGDGAGHFTDQTITRIPSAFLPPIRHEWYIFLHIVDFNRDGFPDIAISAAVTGGIAIDPGTPYVFINDGRGNFNPLTQTAFGPRSNTSLGQLIPLDPRGDGTLDFLNVGYLYELFEPITPFPGCAAPLDHNQHGLTGSWYEPAASGQGFELEVFPNPSSGTGSTFVSWFTYDSVIGGAERQRWYTLQGPVVTGRPNASLTIYQNTGGNFNAPPATNAQAVGTATLSFTTCSSANMSYTFTDGTGRTGAVPLTRLLPNVTCSATAPYPTNADFALSGNWYTAATSGQGMTVEVNPTSGAFFAAWYTYMPNGSAAGAAGQRWYTAQGAFTPGLRTIPVQVYETAGGRFDTPTPSGQRTVSVGTGTMTYQSCSAATFNYNFTGGANIGLSGLITLSRVGPVPPGCTQ